jgi:hypothetical protein
LKTNNGENGQEELSTPRVVDGPDVELNLTEQQQGSEGSRKK